MEAAQRADEAAVKTNRDEWARVQRLARRGGLCRETDDGLERLLWPQIRQAVMEHLEAGDPSGEHGITNSDVNHTLYGMFQSGEFRDLPTFQVIEVVSYKIRAVDEDEAEATLRDHLTFDQHPRITFEGVDERVIEPVDA